MDMQQSERTHQIAAEYAAALLAKDERRLSEMTRPKGGSAGKLGDSNVSRFQSSGARRIIRTVATDDLCMVLYGGKTGDQPIHATSFRIADGRVQGDWINWTPG